MNKYQVFSVRFLLCLLLVLSALGDFSPPCPALAATKRDIVGPPGSGTFGKTVTVLPNGNIVVTDSKYDAGIIANVGAVYLYNGATGTLISMLTGSTANDRVGDSGVTVLANGNYVVASSNWNNGAAIGAGAVTWGNGVTGIAGVVTTTNSLVGSTANDRVGWWVTALTNGNYVVGSFNWTNGAATSAGAVTWGNGATGITGVVTTTNSLVGSATDDRVGHAILELPNGNYVVRSYEWANGSATRAGAATWGNGATGITGVVTTSNSLVGTSANDLVGGNVTALTNGNYVVKSLSWTNGVATSAGAATWGNGATGITGAVTTTNSLVGSTANDRVGGNVVALSNGNYVVASSTWTNGAATSAGAVTWGNGATGITGTVTTTNSLVGSTTNDGVGIGVAVLTNGNYVVVSSNWTNGAATRVGAATWGNGATGLIGIVTTTNSLVGSTTDDRIGSGRVTSLTNGNYVVASSNWTNGAATNAGAATWGNGDIGIIGMVAMTNSLVGSTVNDGVGNGRVIALTNGNYVVASPSWDNGVAVNTGAATWGNGATGITGAVTTTNSLVGSTMNDGVGNGRVTALTNGHYVVGSPTWNNGAATYVGAVTWGNGVTGITGTVTTTNSLVGSTADDSISGGGGVTALTNGHYVVRSSDWDNGAIVNAGAVTLGRSDGSTTGPLTADNSVLGETADGGSGLNFAYDAIHNQLVVGHPADNKVSLFSLIFPIYLPLVRR